MLAPRKSAERMRRCSLIQSVLFLTFQQILRPGIVNVAHYKINVLSGLVLVDVALISGNPENSGTNLQ